MYEVMANPNIVLPHLDDQLNWDVTLSGAEKPLRFLNVADLRALGASVNGPQASAYARVRALLGAGEVVEDIDPQAFLTAFWGDGV